MINKYLITGFADEIDPSIKVQFEELNRLGVKYFEPRGVDGKNISSITPDEAVKLKETMDKYGIKASSIGSPIGKINIKDDFEEHLLMLENVIEIAKILGTKYIRVFSFFMDEGTYEENRSEVMRRMKAMVKLAEENDIILLHENEKGIYGNIAPRCADILKEVNSPNLRAVFDPANFVECDQVTYPDGFELMKPYIEYMHIKDARADKKIVPAGMGIGNIKSIVTELNKMGYKGFYSIEPHLTEFMGFAELENSSEATKRDNSIKKPFDVALNALLKVFEEVGE